jgi:tetratricopeptide (TPR) repeat protein
VEKEIAIEINTPYEANFNLQTSAAGELVNKGREFLQKGMYNEAIEQLAEALKRQPDATETHQIQILLGDAFLGYKTYDQALAYYQKAAEAPEYAHKAKLGMAEAQAGLGQRDQALINIIDVVLNTKDPKIQAQAQGVYKRVAPMKSLLYITSDPKGAQLSVNGSPINQPTPVILSDLMVGSYRIAVSKTGFKSYETRVTLPVSAIKPLVVKLVPEP